MAIRTLRHSSDSSRNVNENNDDDNQSKYGKRCICAYMDQTERKYPRLFNISNVIVTLMLLICLSMLCGHFLAVFERSNELDDIHSTMASFMTERGRLEMTVNGLQDSYENCLENYLGNQTNPEVINGTELKSFMKVCKTDGLKTANDAVRSMQDEEGEGVLRGIGLNWNRCLGSVQMKGDDVKIKPYEQGYTLGIRWFQSFELTFSENLMNGMDKPTAFTNAIDSARSMMNDVCTVNTAGGAMFWFTIMTTIGYGNTAPVTNEGRGLVYTAGFLSILIFAALIGMAGYTILTIVDDFLNFAKMKTLTKGWLSVLFWLFILFLWTLVLAGINNIYTKKRYDDIYIGESFSDRFWWAYITITTVGFGDYYIPHETFLPYDMIFIPLAVLLGFVFLANFGLKLSETINEIMKNKGFLDGEPLKDILEANRHNDFNVESSEKEDAPSTPLEILVENKE